MHADFEKDKFIAPLYVKASDFIDILAEIRAGTAPESTLRALLARCSAPLELEDGILPTQLFTHRADVDAINDKQLASLEGTAVTFTAQDSGDTASLQAACPAPRTVRLKVGAQVMLTRNLSSKQGLVNGARGVVEKFTPSGLPVVKFARGGDSMTIGRERYSIRQGGQDIAVRSQIPLALAWAVTVHKSQGLTLDRVEVSLDRAFEAGMAYGKNRKLNISLGEEEKKVQFWFYFYDGVLIFQIFSFHLQLH